MVQSKDEIWEAAWQWAQYPVHETPDGHPDLEQLKTWLDADPAHRQAYEKACHLWLMTGLVPPAGDE